MVDIDHHGHSHHHHKHGEIHEDGSAIFKRKSLNAIERRKKISKVLFICMLLVAITMLTAAIYLYMFGV